MVEVACVVELEGAFPPPTEGGTTISPKRRRWVKGAKRLRYDHREIMSIQVSKSNGKEDGARLLQWQRGIGDLEAGTGPSLRQRPRKAGVFE